KNPVKNSIVGRCCTIKKGTIIYNCIVLADCTIGENVHIENLVVDKHAKITHAKEIIRPADELGYIKRNDTL
ncbi:glucose-1-phosphate adenylyltransferase subunit GlgD, partial [Anaerosalibacter bizertensis]|nr:glucose-1-phosphate adenylyltransferase subunit GlgD [Anaerosalibacter bizertensis]